MADDEARFAGQEALFARVRDSLRFAENAPVSTERPAEPTGVH